MEKQKYQITPPPASNIGAECSIAFTTSTFPEKVAINALIGPIPGVDNQTINQGKRPRTTNTPKIIP